MTRVALLHPKGVDGSELEGLRIQVSQALARAGHDDARVITGKADWERNFKKAGSWDAWEWQVACGADPITQTPNYTLYIIAPGRQVGAATRRIVEHALEKGKTCAFWDGERFKKVSRVRFLGDVKNYKSGWEVVL